MKKKYYLYKMNELALNIISIAILIIMVLITEFVYNDESFILTFSDTSYMVFIALMFPYLMLHELLHSLSYVLHGASYKNITYGMHLEKGIFCCLCKQNITKKNILISVLYPFVFIGVVTYIIGVLLNNNVLILLSLVNISGCAGDLMMFFGLLRVKDFEYSEFDNPMAFGLYSENDLSELKLLGLNYIEEQDELERNDLKKLTISKESKFLLALVVVLVFALLVMRWQCR